VSQDHPLRAVRKLADVVFRSLSFEFDALYADSGWPSIEPKYILQVVYSVRSDACSHHRNYLPISLEYAAAVLKADSGEQIEVR
jgi:hypothetical protein